MKNFILGSCVTRDIFRVMEKNEEVIDYYARTSIRSLVSSPVYVDENQINLSSSFKRRMVMRDLSKTFFDDLSRKEFDFLIIDLIDERFRLLNTGNSIITRSSYFINSGIENILDTFPVTNNLEEWEKDCEIFASKVLSIIPPSKVIIHESYWASQYLDGDNLKDFDNQKSIMENNINLKEYYRILKQKIPCKTISLDDVKADSNHKWGLSPYHYTDEYYKEIYNQLRAL